MKSWLRFQSTLVEVTTLYVSLSPGEEFYLYLREIETGRDIEGTNSDHRRLAGINFLSTRFISR